MEDELELPARESVSRCRIKREESELIRRLHGQETLTSTPARTTPGLASDDTTPDNLPVVSRVGRYVVVDVVGWGGMGVVLKAYDPDLNRPVAIKLIRTPCSRGESESRLLREAQAMARLSHPNVVQVYDVGTHGPGEVYLAMEYVAGSTLGRWLEDCPRSPGEVVSVFIAAGKGLAAAHRKGIVHRDFKPQNVMIGSDGRVLVTDFGLARSIDTHECASTLEIDQFEFGRVAGQDGKETATGTMVGTPAYMSPEQYMGHAVDERSDQFSFCVSLYEALFGARPRRCLLPNETVDFPRKTTPRVASGVVTALRKGLSFESGSRFSTMTDLLAALERCRFGTGWWVAAGTVLCVSVVALAATALDSASCERTVDEVPLLWTVRQKASVHDAIAASGSPVARAAWSHLVTSVDGYSKDSRRLRVEACRARTEGSISPAQEANRLSCLDRARNKMTDLVDRLERADTSMVDGLYRSTVPLVEVQHCGDDILMSETILGPDKADKGANRSADALLGYIDDAWVALQLGRYPSAREYAAKAVALARPRALENYLPEALRVLAEVHAEEKEWPEASQGLMRAANKAVELRQDRQATRIWIRLVVLGAHDAIDLDVVSAWHDQATAWIARTGELDPYLRAEFANATGRLASRRGDNKEAVEHHERALKLYEYLQGVAGTRTFETRRYISNAKVFGGHLAHARDDLRSLRQDVEEALGRDHPLLGDVAYDLSSVLLELGEYAQAEPVTADALRIFERLHGKNGRQTIWGRFNLAKLMWRRGDVAESQEILAMIRSHVQQDDMRWPMVVVAQGYLARLMGNIEHAKRYHEESLATVGRVHPADHARVIYVKIMTALASIGVARDRKVRNQIDEAKTSFARARELLDEVQASIDRTQMELDPSNLASYREGLAVLAEEAGDMQTAVKHLETALRARQDVPFERWELAGTQWALARVIADEDRARARDLARASIAAYREWSIEFTKTQVDTISAWLEIH